MRGNAVELNNAQIDRQDFVDNAIHNLREELAGRELEWDLEVIGTVRDSIGEVFKDGIMTEMEFYPYMEITPSLAGGVVNWKKQGF